MAAAAVVEEAPTCYICMEEATAANPFLSRPMCPCSAKADSSLQIHQLCLELARDHTGKCHVCKKPLDGNWAFDAKFERTKLEYGNYSPWRFEQRQDGVLHGAAYQLERRSESYGPLRYLSQRHFYVDGKQHGQQTDMLADGTVVSEGNYDAGLKHGLFVERNPKGVITSESTYAADVLHGMSKRQYGTVMLSGEWSHGLKVGEHLEAGSEDRHPFVQRVNYIQGKKNGVLLAYHPECGEGLPVRRAEMRDDKKHGLLQRWHLDVEQLKTWLTFEGSFVDGTPNGRHVHYRHGTDKKHEELYYIMGAKHGVQRSYDYRGLLYLEETYEMNVKHGQVRKYEDGKLIMDASYNNGFRHGLHAVVGDIYSPDFKISFWSDGTKELRHGRITKTDRNGHMTGNYKMGVRDGRFTLRQGSVPQWSLSFRNGILDGDCVIYHSDDGSLKARGTMRAGAPIGRHSLWFPCGKIRESVNYDDGSLLHGICIFNHWPGVPEQVLNFVHGVLHGRQTFYDEFGRLSAIVPMRNGLVHGLVRRYDERGAETTTFVKEGDLNDYASDHVLRGPSKLDKEQYFERQFLCVDGTLTTCDGKATCMCDECRDARRGYDEYECYCSLCCPDDDDYDYDRAPRRRGRRGAW